MNRAEIKEVFRTENPEITTNVVTDAQLNIWCKQADKVICAIARCITGSISFTSASDEESWKLTDKDPKFYDIDENPGGGVAYNNKRLGKTTKADLDSESPNWRTRDSGTPKKYYRRGEYIYFDRPVDDAKTIDIDIVKISDDFDDDSKTPYNQLSYLEPFHYGINKYLQWKAKWKVRKYEEAQIAKEDFFDYAKWMKKELIGGKFGIIHIKPSV